MAKISLRNVNKVYPGGAHAVHDFNIEIEDKEFIVFVGPSGCGKSTTLRMIAGLEEISYGDFEIDGVRMNDVPPKDRDIAMVFQSYALYPHMTVYENMAFGLKLKKTPREEIKERVLAAAEILDLTKYLDRKPKALSGGQRQRVALGRAIVRAPKVFLMDEPLSNLDAKLRVQTRSEIIKLHKSLGNNTIYVTHDQIEAMTMADRIVVMSMGYVQQIGTPKEVHDTPVNMFVAGFIGTPPMNFIYGNVNSDKTFTAGSDLKITIPEGKFKQLQELGYVGKEIVFGIRPENIHNDANVLEAYSNAQYDMKVQVCEFLGDSNNVFATINGKQVIAILGGKESIKIGDTVKVAFDMNKCHFFDKETELRIK